MTHDPLVESLVTLVSALALWAFARWPLRRLRRDLLREGRSNRGDRQGS
jgi:hypothetical protein